MNGDFELPHGLPSCAACSKQSLPRIDWSLVSTSTVWDDYSLQRSDIVSNLDAHLPCLCGALWMRQSYKRRLVIMTSA